MKKILVPIVLIVVIVWGGWLVAVPSDAIINAISNNLSRGGVELEIVGFRKGIFYNVYIEALDIKKSGKRLLSVDDVSVKAELVKSLLGRKLVSSYKGGFGGGKLSGGAEVKGGGYKADIKIKGAELSKLSIFDHLPAKGAGALDADVNLADNSVSARFSITGAKISATEGGAIVPLDIFHTIKGALNFKENVIEMTSVTLEAKDVRARAKGTIRGNMLDVRIEVMPEEDNEIIPVLLEKYMVSPGYYIVQVKQNIASPF